MSSIPQIMKLVAKKALEQAPKQKQIKAEKNISVIQSCNGDSQQISVSQSSDTRKQELKQLKTQRNQQINQQNNEQIQKVKRYFLKKQCLKLKILYPILKEQQTLSIAQNIWAKLSQNQRNKFVASCEKIINQQRNEVKQLQKNSKFESQGENEDETQTKNVTESRPNQNGFEPEQSNATSRQNHSEQSANPRQNQQTKASSVLNERVIRQAQILQSKQQQPEKSPEEIGNSACKQNIKQVGSQNIQKDSVLEKFYSFQQEAGQSQKKI